MIEFTQQHPILTVCIVFGSSLIAMIVVMLLTDENDK